MKTKNIKADFCVVGGGLAGSCAAIAAARKGLKTVLIQDRPVLGGNVSSEIRIWPIGAEGDENHETGIAEELLLENSYRNPNGNWTIWDSIIYGKVRFCENLTLLLNCSCNGAEMDGKKIRSVKAWQTTTETWYIVEADYFGDCSGDGILAPLTGAEYREGREAKSLYGESWCKEEADNLRIGQGIMLQAREMTTPQPFIAPEWAYSYPTDESFPTGTSHDFREQNFWWFEVGNLQDTISEAEDIHTELLKMAFGMWDHIKKDPKHHAENWALDWVGFLPEKQESRRYVGDYTLNQNDVENGVRFEDAVAYGGWPVEDHPDYPYLEKGLPIGMYSVKREYHIPFRSLYSANIENLMFAGRDISTSHMALTSTRVMLTCAICGQAIGTAAYLAGKYHMTPRELGQNRIQELQDMLMTDDCYLPEFIAPVCELTKEAALTATEGDAEALRNGKNRVLKDVDYGWCGKINDEITYTFEKEENVQEAVLIFDSEFTRNGSWKEHHPLNMPNFYPLEGGHYHVPDCMVKGFELKGKKDGEWYTIQKIPENYQRFVKIPIHEKLQAVKLIPQKNWGEQEKVHIFAFEVR